MKDIWNIGHMESKGIVLHFSKDFDKNLKVVIQYFVRWVRKQYCFPIKLVINIKNTSYVVNSITGEKATASIFLPFDKNRLPHMQVSIGNYEDLKEIDLLSADCNVLESIAHEITHYYQWLKDDAGTGNFSERQARYKAKQIVYKYLDYCYEE